MITEEEENIKRRCMEVQTYTAMLNKDVNACCQEGEEKHEISFFLKSYALRKQSKKKRTLLKY